MRVIITLLLCLIGYVYINAYTIQYTNEFANILKLYGTCFYSIVFIHIYRGLKTLPILECNQYLYKTMLPVCILCTMNIYQPYTGCVLLLIYCICYDRYNCLDSKLIHVGLIYTPFILSVPDTVWLYGYIYTVALVFFSAGFEKIFSPTWIKGKSVKLFFNNHHMTRSVSPILTRVMSMKVNNYILVLTQLLYLPSVVYLTDIYILCVTILCIFSICLFTFVELSYIGQLLLIHLGLSIYTTTYHAVEINPGVSMTLSAIIVIILIVCTSVSIMLYTVCWKLNLQKWLKRITGIGQQIGVFSDKELSGCYVYKLTIPGNDNALPVFDSNGEIGKLSSWNSRVFQSYTYNVTEYIMGKLLPELYTKQQRIASSTSITKLLECCYNNIYKQHSTLQMYVKYLDPGQPKNVFTNSKWVKLLTATRRDKWSIIYNEHAHDRLHINNVYKNHRKKFSTLHVYFDETCDMCQKIKKCLNKIDILNACKLHDIDNIDPVYYTTLTSTRNDTIYTGFETYRQIFSNMILLYPIYIITLLPGVAYIGDRIYHRVSKSRKCSIGKKCT